MKFTNSLIKGKFIKRYKRFFVDIKLNNKKVTAHCPNTGSMKGLLDVDNDVWLLKNNNPERKLKYTLEIINIEGKMVGVNTHRTNRIVEHALNSKLVDEFKKIKSLKSEFKYDSETRFDFLCDKKIIEVKNVSLLNDNETCSFPDAVTERGSKHLKKLIESKDKGFNPYVLFLTQIQDIKYFKIAKDIDPKYYENFVLAKNKGVKFLAYKCKVNSKEIRLDKKIKIIDD